LSAGASENCTLTYSTPQSVLDSNGGGDGDIDNTANAAATYNAAPVSANGSTTVALVITPGLIIEKFASTAGPVSNGNTIGYSYRVTNTGNVTIANVTINDSHNGYGSDPVPGSEAMFNDVAPLGNSTDVATNGSWDSLSPGDTIVFTANYTVVQADIDNLQ
jgi:large repetitive protein